MVKSRAHQIITVSFAEDNVAEIEKWVESFNADMEKIFPKQYLAESWKDAEVDINIYGFAYYYPSHSYYEPDEYEYDEVFVPEDDTDIVREWFEDCPLVITNIKIAEIEYEEEY